MKLTFGEFKSNKQGAYILIAAEDIVGFFANVDNAAI